MWLRITGNNDIPPRSDTLGTSSVQPGYGSPAGCEREAAPPTLKVEAESSSQGGSRTSALAAMVGASAGRKARLCFAPG